jgi:hypothetical protein
LVKQSRTTYIAPDEKTSVSCSISREYDQSGQPYYWFGFHLAQKQHLEQAVSGFVAFVCGVQETTFLFPIDQLKLWLDGLNQTIKPDRSYWHIHITKSGESWFLKRKRGFKDVDITSFLL